MLFCLNYKVWYELVQEISEGWLSSTDAQNPIPHASAGSVSISDSQFWTNHIPHFPCNVYSSISFKQIRSFPSREFYSDSLDDGPDLERITKRRWHEYRCFGPFSFFDIDGVESQPSGSGSWINVDEVDFILITYHQLVTKYPELKSTSRLAIISPYRHQVKLFHERFREKFGVQSDQLVDINTVDGFQVR